MRTASPGSADRAWIGNLVYDSLRRKQSLSHFMQSDTWRAIALAALRHSWDMAPAEIAALCTGEGFCPEPLTPDEEKGLANADLSGAAPWVQGDYPEWLHGSFAAAFGDDAIREGRALAKRAPADLRVNSLKATRDKVMKALVRHGAVETPYSPLGVRLPPREGGARSPNVEAEPAHGRGWFEVQDEGSQIAALLAGAGPRLQVADICAGAGGKTLAMAAQMQNTGQIYAYDADPIRFRPIFERLEAGGRAECANASAGPGWRAHRARRPDGPRSHRRAMQRDRRLAAAAGCEMAAHSGAAHGAHGGTAQRCFSLRRPLVKPGGTLAYVTCSLLPEENEKQIEDFLESNPAFTALNLADRAARILSRPIKNHLPPGKPGLLLTPAWHETDGFYIALLSKKQQ